MHQMVVMSLWMVNRNKATISGANNSSLVLKEVLGNTFVHNSAESDGGALHCLHYTIATVTELTPAEKAAHITSKVCTEVRNWRRAS